MEYDFGLQNYQNENTESLFHDLDHREGQKVWLIIICRHSNVFSGNTSDNTVMNYICGNLQLNNSRISKIPCNKNKGKFLLLHWL